MMQFTSKNKLWLLGLLSTIIYLVNLRVGDLLAQIGILNAAPHPIVSFLIQIVPLSVFYVLALWLVGRPEEKVSKHLVPVIFLFALLFRLPLITQSPVLSSDLYRYLWDGKVQVSGLNPYLFPPEDGHLSFLRDEEIYPNINRKESRTVYPAGAQLLFWSINWLGLDTPIGFKAAALGADALTLLLLLLLLKEVGLPQSHLLIYAWNPLIIYELFSSGHLESFMLPPLLAFTYFFLRGQLLRAGAALGLATAIKLVPALLLITIPPGKRLKVTLPFVLVLALSYSVYAGAGEKILGFLPSYFSDPYEIFNPGLIQAALLWVAKSFSFPSPWIRYLLLPFLLAVLTAIARRPYASPEDLIEKIYITLSAYLLLIYPAFHPWYLCSLIPLLCLVPSRAWIYLSLALPLSYLKYLAPTGTMPAWITLAQFAPLYALLATEYVGMKPLMERRYQWHLGTQTPSSTTL
ncbi:MAG: hypothetical protein ACREQA_17385 [Candidatus Binatia bacterium]